MQPAPFRRLLLADMKHDLIEHTTRISANRRDSAKDRWGALDFVEGAVELLSSLIEVVLGILV